MASSSLYSVDEFKLFHSIDRNLYTILVINLWRHPMESMQVIALFLWLERMGFSNIVRKILCLPQNLINDIADEAIICLTSIFDNHCACEVYEIPLLHSLTDKEFSLNYVHDHRTGAVESMSRIAKEVCFTAFHDIMREASERAINVTKQKLNTSSSNITQYLQFDVIEFTPEDHKFLSYAQEIVGVPPEERTMFVTFSKGHPVHEREIREFLTSYYGDCIESLHMQDVELHKQALYARIVFHSTKTAEMILGRMDKVKFFVNGKHVWARKFVQKCSPEPCLSIHFVPDKLYSLF